MPSSLVALAARAGLLALHLRPTHVARAMPAHPSGFTLTNPGGRPTPFLYQHGDARFNYLTDGDGYPVVKDPTSGWYCYAAFDEGKNDFSSTGLRVGAADPAESGLTRDAEIGPGLMRSALRGDDSLLKDDAMMKMASDDARPKYIGNFSYLVLNLRFADHSSRKLPSRDDLEMLMNHEGPYTGILPVGSMRDHFLMSSHGKFDVTSVVTDWITLPHNHSHYAKGYGVGENMRKGVEDALDFLESNQNFSFTDSLKSGTSEYIGVAVFHSGYGAEWGGRDCYSGEENPGRVWSHMRGIDWSSPSEGVKFRRMAVQSALWSTCGDEMAHLGVVAHEAGHVLGLPDMYFGNGVGSWDLMGNSWGFDWSGHYPSLLSAHSKMVLGWLQPTIAVRSGAYALGSAARHPDAVLIRHGFPESGDEYLLMENRQPVSFDSKIGAVGGIAIWHIDLKSNWSVRGGYPNMTAGEDAVPWPQNGLHYPVALLQADGMYDLEKKFNFGNANDLWRANRTVGLLELGPGGLNDGGGPFPNTDAYQSGIVTRTGVRIYNFSESRDAMTFTVLLGGEAVFESTEAQPSSYPSFEPTHNPVPKPTPAPILKQKRKRQRRRRPRHLK